MNFWKYGQILIIWKSLTIKQLRFSNKRFFIWIYHLVLHHILNLNIKFGMWINFIIFPFCDGLVKRAIHIFQLQKSITTNKWVFLSINKHVVLFLYWIVQGTILTNLTKNKRLCVGPIMLILASTIIILGHGHGSFEAEIMELLVQIQIPINKSKDILITKCIWIKGTK